MTQARYWIGVASRQHVLKGMAGGFTQLCHGKERPLKRMAKGDLIIYYSPQEVLGEKQLCQRFTAIGEVIGDDIYQVAMAPGFIPFRRDIRFLAAKEIPIRPLIDHLSFIKDKNHWGYVFRYGHVQIHRADFQLIAEAMSAGISKQKEEK